jgi:predicted nucleotidyltransferase
VDATALRSTTERIESIGLADDRLRAVLVYGSHATGSADAFSDLDVGLVIADAFYDDVLAHSDELVHKIGQPLLNEDFGNPANLHLILADGVELELILTRASDLMLELPYRVLVDKDGVEAQARARHAPPGPGVESTHVRQVVIGFWHDVGHLVTALGRGNTWWAYGQLDELRRMCLNLARMEAGVPPEDEAYWKVDDAVPADRLASLRATLAPPEIGPMTAAASAVLDLYRELAVPLADRHRVPYPAALDRLVSGRLSGLR